VPIEEQYRRVGLRFPRSRVAIAVAASVATALVVGGVAWAVQSPVDQNGVIHACYNPSNGEMHLDVKGSCPAKGQSTPITWNATGLNGSTGATGATGPSGASGEATDLAITMQGTKPFETDEADIATVEGITLHVTCGVFGYFIHASSALPGASLDWTGYSHFFGGQQVFESTGTPANGVDILVHSTPVQDFLQGSITLRQLNVVGSQAEQGMWVSLFWRSSVSGPDGPSRCDVTGVAVPYTGTRVLPRPVIITP